MYIVYKGSLGGWKIGLAGFFAPSSLLFLSRRSFLLFSSSFLLLSSQSLPSLLLPTQAQRLAYAAETQPAEQLVDAQAAEQAVDDAAQAETVEQLADETEDTAEQ